MAQGFPADQAHLGSPSSPGDPRARLDPQALERERREGGGGGGGGGRGGGRRGEGGGRGEGRGERRGEGGEGIEKGGYEGME